MSILPSPVSKYTGYAGRTAVFICAALVLAACQTKPSYVEKHSIADFDYRKRHPILISEVPENLDIPVSGDVRTINGSMKNAVAAFGRQSKEDGNGFVEVLVPSGSANEAAVRAISPQIRAALKDGGVSASHIVMRTYPVSDMSASAPVRLSFMRMRSVVRNCGNWPNAMNGTPENGDYHNFGCATQANLAAMVDQPADLLRPRPQTPADAERTKVILTKNREGQATPGKYIYGVGAQVSSF